MGSVLIVDDIAGNARLIERVLEPDGHSVRTAAGGAEALQLLQANPPDLVIMDVMMPQIDGFEACRKIKQDPNTRLIPVVLATSLDDTASRIRGIEAGADDFVTKPFNALELRARVRSLLRIKSYTDDLDGAESVIVSLAMTIEARDSTTAGHCQRLVRYASALGRTLGLDEDDVAVLARGGFLHDIGKVGIPDHVLNKPGPLTADELVEMRRHPELGREVILKAEARAGVRDDVTLAMAKDIVYTHHERWDGTGYPQGLRGSDIPVAGRVMALVDVYDAVRARSLYQRCLSHDDTVQLIVKGRGTHFDPAVVEAFLNVSARFESVSDETLTDSA
jgi:putative two-component system response regulator